jgi:uncharacterized membrane protein YdfJ with MMPL/SSD domain
MSSLSGLTQFVLRHRRLVVGFWLALTAAGIVAAGPAFRAFSAQYSVPGREGYETNEAITHSYGNGGDSAPVVAVVTLPAATSAGSPLVTRELDLVETRIERAVSRVRVASYASSGDRAFVSRDGRTTLLAFVPLLVALISIMTSILCVWGLASVTPVSGIVGFLIALVGLGVAVDYSLLVVVRWREERADGNAGDAAVVRAMATAGRAVLFSGTTVAIGLLALVALPVPFLRSVGYGGLLIPLVSVAVALTLLPVILSTVGPRLDWPHLRTADRASRSWTRWGGLVVRHRFLAAGAAVAVLAALLAGATTLRLGPANGNPDTISRRGKDKQGLEQLERSGIGAGVLSPIEILAPRTQATELARRLDGIETSRARWPLRRATGNGTGARSSMCSPATTRA